MGFPLDHSGGGVIVYLCNSGVANDSNADTQLLWGGGGGGGAFKLYFNILIRRNTTTIHDTTIHDDTRIYTYFLVNRIFALISPDYHILSCKNHELVVLQMLGVIVYLCNSGVGKPDHSYSANRG
jgi:hypothetical protein